MLLRSPDFGERPSFDHDAIRQLSFPIRCVGIAAYPATRSYSKFRRSHTSSRVCGEQGLTTRPLRVWLTPHFNTATLWPGEGDVPQCPAYSLPTVVPESLEGMIISSASLQIFHVGFPRPHNHSYFLPRRQSQSSCSFGQLKSMSCRRTRSMRHHKAALRCF